MNEFDFEKLKDIKIDFPESWVQNALEIPSKEHKKPAPILLYRYAAVIAACVVMGFAVTLTMIFGVGKNNVNLTKPNTDYSSGYSVTPDDTIPNGTGGYTAPTDNLPVIFGTDNSASPAVTEPSESGGNSGDNNTAAKPGRQSANRQAARGGTQNNGNGNKAQNATASSGDTQPLTDSPAEPPVTQEPPDETDPWVEPWYPPPTEYYPPPTESQTVEPAGEDDLTSYFITYISESLAQGNIYCRLEDENGNIVDGSNIFSRSHRAMKYNMGNGTVRLTYLHYIDKSGGRYNVIFYNSDGVVLKQGSVVVNTGRSHYI